MAMSRPSEHWQVDKSLKECNQHMFLNEEFSDVTFVLDYKDAAEKKEVVHIPALQTLLLARSPVFAAMFTGDLAEKKDKPVIPVDDVEPESFKEMLKFVYTDEAHLNADNVLHVLYTAKKYIITNLAKKCAEFLEENLSADTAANLLEQSMMFDEKDLKNKVLTKIEQEASAVLSSDDFPKLSKEALREVLQLNLQITSEMKVFEACMQWAENKCQQLQITTDGANLREVLGDNFSLIRFPTMTADDISDSVLPRDILTTHEGLQIFRYLTVTSKPENLPFPTEPRPNPTPRLPIEPRPDPTPRSLLIPAPYVQLQGTLSCLESCTKNTSLNCTVSRSIKIKGIIVHAMGGGIQLSVTLTQKGKTLLKYDNTLTRSSKRCTVDANDARVKAGSLLVEIKLKFTNYYFHDWNYNFEASSPTTRNLSDKFVSIDFNPVAENLLLGVEYSPM